MSMSTISKGPFRKLRVMIVDDNHINLSVLSTLLKRRFSALLEDQPVTVDSGLKAIQILRTNVFDLILMDIQMPFLSGLEASMRIRNGEDGVLAANQNAHIVAVTTAVGDEPELAYRRAGMDGMIGKPVRYQDMEHYLCPLAHEAHNAAPSVSPVCVDGQSVMPPLPPTLSFQQKRLFYLPANAEILSPCPDICKGADFEKRLRAQTRDSLRLNGAVAIARSVTWSESSRMRRAESLKSVSQIEELEEPIQPTTSYRYSSPKRSHLRGPSLTINSRTFSQQVARELANIEGASDFSDPGSGSDAASAPSSVSRPKAVHRTTSPAWLLTRDCDTHDDFTSSPSSQYSTLNRLSPTSSPSRRPTWLTDLKSRVSSSSGLELMSSPTSYNSSDDFTSFGSTLPVWNFRRASEMSSVSALSESSEVTTPANEEPQWPTLNDVMAESDVKQKRSSIDTISLQLPKEKENLERDEQVEANDLSGRVSGLTV